MKYRISHLPNTGHAIRFKVLNPEGDKETQFSFSKCILDIWGKPAEQKLGEVMIAHIKKNGWSKTPVEVCSENSLKNINRHIASLSAAKGKAAK